MKATVSDLQISDLERGRSPPRFEGHGLSHWNLTDKVNQPTTFTRMDTRPASFAIVCPRSEQRRPDIVQSQAIAAEGADEWACWNAVGWNSVDGISIPDSVATQDTMDRHLLASESAELRETSEELSMFQATKKGYVAVDDPISPSSSLAPSTFSGYGSSDSPSTSLADEESFVSMSASADSFLHVDRLLKTAETFEHNFSRTNEKLRSSLTVMHAQVHLEADLREKCDYTREKGENHFTDSTEYYYNTFSTKLQALDSRNSEGSLGVENYLIESEADWFNHVRRLKLRKLRALAPRSSAGSSRISHHATSPPVGGSELERVNQFAREDGHRTSTGWRRLLLFQIGDWPVYSLLIALVRLSYVDEEFLANTLLKGQILAVSSYHISLLTGKIAQSNTEFYVMSSIYIAMSSIWWLLFRKFKSVYTLAAPFLFYGLAFFFLALAPCVESARNARWLQNIATAHYAAASSSGGFYFALNFANERSWPPFWHEGFSI